jgi:Thioredoxin like C-terminal domain
VAPDSLRLNQWARSGDWTIERRASVLNRADGRIAFRFHPRDVHLVMRQRERGTSVPLRVLVDGEPPSDDHGLDVDEQGHGTLVQPQFCQLIRQRG